MSDKIKEFEKRHKKENKFDFSIGDTVDVHFQITEAGKKRIQVFSGVVIARKGSGVRETFTVRRVSYGEGVERIFPVHSPLVEKVSVIKRGKPRRAKLYYFRKRKGKKATKVEEKIE